MKRAIQILGPLAVLVACQVESLTRAPVADVVAASSPAITQTLLTAGGGTTNQKVYTTASFGPSPNALVTVAVATYSSLGTPPIPTLAGGGMAAWNVVTTVTFDGSRRRLTIYRALSAAPGTGTLTLTSAMTLSNMQWIVSQWSGVDTTGTNGSGAIAQVANATGDGTTGLSVAFSQSMNPGNVTYGAFGVVKNTAAVTPGSGFTEISEQPSGESTPADVQTEWAPNLNTITASWPSSNAGALGVELESAIGGSVLPPLPPPPPPPPALPPPPPPPPPPADQCGLWPAGITAWVQPLAQSTGQAFFVSPTGADDAPGTMGQPWKSISKANQLKPGQILYVRAGTYGARGTIVTFNPVGTASAPITISGYPGDARPTILGKVNISGQWLRVTGMLFDGPSGNVGGPGPNGEAVLVSLSGSHTELSNSEVRHAFWHGGIGGPTSATDYRIINNYVHDNGGYLGDYTDDQWNTSHGMYMSPSSYGLIANNVIEHNDAKGFMARHSTNHLLVVNNTILANGRHGISTTESTHDWIVANNIILNNGNAKGGDGASMDGSGGASYVLRRNVFWHNGTSGQDHWSGSGLTISEPLLADPRLVRPATYSPRQDPAPHWDDQLLAGSPAIGYADPNYALPFDFTGKCRGTAPDAGAYQH